MNRTILLLGSVIISLSFGGRDAFAQATDVDCDGCVDSADLALGAVRGPNIANGHIVSKHIKNGNLITQKIKDGAITAEKIAPSAVGVTQVDPAQIQLRVGSGCGVGSFLVAVNEDGSVSCGTGTTEDGNFNTLYGGNAFVSNTTGFENIAIGLDALFSNTEGAYNTAIGLAALNGNTTGIANTAVGYAALALGDAGNFNTAIGSLAGLDTDGYDNIVIGDSNYGVPGENSTIRIGTADWQYWAFIAGIRGVTTGIANATSVVIDSNGQLGTINSSVRYKEDIQDMGEASDKLLQLRPVTYRYKKPYQNGEKPLDYGLIAEEVAEVFPELVVYNEEGQPETVKYRLLSTLLLNELQKEHRVNVDQTAMLNDQAIEMAELRTQTAEVQELRAQVAELTLLVTQLAKSGELNQGILVAATGAD